MKHAPIVLFTYNRLSHTQQTVRALQANTLAKDSDLFIYSDAAKKDEDIPKVEALREWIKTIDGFHNVTIIYRIHNFGLAKSIIDGVTTLVKQCGKVIVVEDDLVVSPHFLTFMNDSLDRYQTEEKVAAITGYSPDFKKTLPETYFLRGGDCCWGWATWERAWQGFEPDGKKLLASLEQTNAGYDFDYQGMQPNVQMLRDQIQGYNNSWAIRWHASAFLENQFTLYPGRSLVHNIGNDNTGVHSIATKVFDVQVTSAPIVVRTIPVVQDQDALKAYVHFYKKLRAPWYKRIIKYVLGRV